MERVKEGKLKKEKKRMRRQIGVTHIMISGKSEQDQKKKSRPTFLRINSVLKKPSNQLSDLNVYNWRLEIATQKQGQIGCRPKIHQHYNHRGY